MTDTKPTNPKDAIGSRKLNTGLIPPAGLIEQAKAHFDGAIKYGAFNWREAGVRASVYIGAIDRHRMAFLDGENFAPDSMVHHLGHINACCNIMLDSISIGNFVDDRPVPGMFNRDVVAANEWVTQRIARHEIELAAKIEANLDAAQKAT
jgi:hypothetical protein